MTREILDFVLACSVCASCKTSNRPPEGLLQPLSIPSRPWSHIALDFVSALPPSQGNTVVLTVVDQFSKAAHFIPLSKLPSARETAVAVIDHVFRIHGLPTDVVSDRGRAVTITALPLHRGNEMPTAVLRSSPSSPHFFARPEQISCNAGIKHGNGR